MQVHIGERIFRGVSSNALAGMFIGADFAGVADTMIMIREAEDGHAVYKLPSRFIPQGPYLMAECSSTNLATQLHGVSDPRAVFSHVLPMWLPLLHKYTLVGSRVDATGKEVSTLLATFDDEMILQGMAALFSAYDVYPSNLHILCNTKSAETKWVFYSLPVSVNLHGTNETYIAPPIIHVQPTSTGQEPIVLVSPDPYGWKRQDLRRALSKQISLPASTTITGLTAVQSGIYTLNLLYRAGQRTPSLEESTEAVAQPLTLL